MRRFAVLLLIGCGRVGFDAAQSPTGDDAGTTDDTNSNDALNVSCLDQACDLWPQCGCDEGSKCDVDLSGVRTCAAAGTGVHGDVCASSADCQPGTTCLKMSGWPQSRCLQFCEVHSDCDALGNGGLCALSATQGNQTLLSACTLPCDLIAQTGCPTQTQCSMYNYGNTAGTNCTAIGTTTLNQTCSSHFDCAPGMMCAGTCKTVCIVGDSSPCTGQTTCVDTGLVSDGVRFGMCN